MTGYYLGATEAGNVYSITEYRIYCDDQTYGYAMSNFEPDGALSITTTDSNYAFDYEDPTPRDQQFSKILKKRVNTQQDHQVFGKVIACIESIIQYKPLQIIGF